MTRHDISVNESSREVMCLSQVMLLKNACKRVDVTVNVLSEHTFR